VSVPCFLAESYLAATTGALEDARSRARRAAELGVGVRYLRTTFLPGDETVFHLFEAPSAAALEDAGRRAALAIERIVEAVEGAAELNAASAARSLSACRRATPVRPSRKEEQ
jgi:hypothetical protein